MSKRSKASGEHVGADPYAHLVQRHRRRTGPLILAAGAGVVILVAIIAVFVTRSSDDPAPSGTGAASAEEATQEIGSVQVTGSALSAYPSGAAAPFTSASDDPAIGTVAPKLTGSTFDGSGINIEPGDGTPKLIMFVAHWCPHCQREVPLVEDWIAAGKLPKGVQIVTVATSTNPDRPNYPPSKWLAKVGWQPKVLLDDESGSAATAYGLPGFPYFVLVDGNGRVVARGSGEVPIDELAARISSLAESDSSTSGG